MLRRCVLQTALTFLLMSLAFQVSSAATRAGVDEPETVMVTLHAKPGADAALAEVVARHWDIARRLNLVIESPHLTMRGHENGGESYIVDIFSWRDASIPDAAPPEIQAIWAEMNRLVEARGGRPGLSITPMSVLAPVR